MTITYRAILKLKLGVLKIPISLIQIGKSISIPLAAEISPKSIMEKNFSRYFPGWVKMFRPKINKLAENRTTNCFK